MCASGRLLGDRDAVYVQLIERFGIRSKILRNDIDLLHIPIIPVR